MNHPFFQDIRFYVLLIRPYRFPFHICREREVQIFFIRRVKLSQPQKVHDLVDVYNKLQERLLLLEVLVPRPQIALNSSLNFLLLWLQLERLFRVRGLHVEQPNELLVVVL